MMLPGGVHTEISAGQQHLIALVNLNLLRECIPEDLADAIELAVHQDSGQDTCYGE